MNKKRIILLVAIVILVLILIYYIFFHTKICGSYECFSQNQIKCSRARYTDDGESAVWKYQIKGEKDNKCLINVKLLQVKEGSVDLEKLQGLDMDCSAPLGYIGNPQGDLKECHGLLKEEMQDLIIKGMHSEVLNNLGKLNDALNQ